MTIRLTFDQSQYWLSKLETETPVQDDPSGIIPVLSNPLLFDTSGKGSNGTNFSSSQSFTI